MKASTRVTAIARGFARSTTAVALLDQAVTSGTNFLSTIAIARSNGAAEFGAYVLALTVLTAILSVQDAVILKPYTIQRYRSAFDESVHAGHALILSFCLSIIAATCLLLAGSLCLSLVQNREFGLGLILLAGVAPFSLMREFARRHAFAHLRPSHALAVDASVSILQVTMLVILGELNRLSNLAGLAALGGACGIVVVVWLVVRRRAIRMATHGLRTTLSESWTLGRWLFVGQMTREVQQSFPYWILSFVSGTAVTAVYAACMSVVSLANPVVFGISNVLTAHNAKAWDSGGAKGLRRQAYRDAILLGAVMAVLCIAILAGGDRLIQAIYLRQEYQGTSSIAFLLAIGMTGAVLGMPASNGLAAIERPRAIVATGFLGVFTTVALVWLLLEEWGLFGAALGFMAGNLVGLAGRWLAFLRLVPEPVDMTVAERIAQQILPVANPMHFTSKVLGSGDHATAIHIAFKADGIASAGTEDLVIKLCKENSTMSDVDLGAEFEALQRLHRMLDGAAVDGWTASVPRPLHIFHAPRASAMTYVGGSHFDKSLARHRDLIPSAAGACATLMRRAWSQGAVHGDFGLQNILFDAERRTIAFIDPGTLPSCSVCCAPTASMPASALDMGHMLADLCTDTSDLIGTSSARPERQLLFETMLEKVVAELGTADEREAWIQALQCSALHHFKALLRPGLSPKGIWHHFVSHIATGRLEATLQRARQFIRHEPGQQLRISNGFQPSSRSGTTSSPPVGCDSNEVGQRHEPTESEFPSKAEMAQ